MNTRIYTLLFSLLLTVQSMLSIAQESLGKDSVIMGASYANEIYYSMANGEVLSSPRNTWDIAFRTGAFSSSILTNDGSGVIAWTYPNSDTSGWATLDTAGLSGWTPMFNDPEDWENGAFSRNALGHPDYGWCVYNAITHNLHGDSLFVIKTRGGNYLKLWLKMKNSLVSTYYFRYANLDGSNVQDITLNGQTYNSKDFVGFDFATGQNVDYQAPKDDWDLLFTKYMSVQDDGTPYPVTGILSNSAVGVTEYRGVTANYSDWGILPWDETRQPIGWDWKAFDLNNMTWIIEDSLAYFVRSQTGDVYKFVPYSFSGSGSGKIVFNVGAVSAVGIENPSEKEVMSVYPNPANQHINIQIPSDINGMANLKISDLSGRLVMDETFGVTNGGLFNFNVSALNNGVYSLMLLNGNRVHNLKLVISQ